MSGRAKAHRASALARRATLLEAAAELSAEVGAGAVTHRAVAARAGVPLSTTSYFFSSIDELVAEALRLGADRHAAERHEVGDAVVEAGVRSADEVIALVVDQALACSRTAQGSQVEYYLAAGRDPALRADASAVLGRSAQQIAEPLRDRGAPQGDDAARAIGAFADGAMLHRLADLDVDHRRQLQRGLRLLAAAAMLTDEELGDLLGRYSPDAAVASPSTASEAALAD